MRFVYWWVFLLINILGGVTKNPLVIRFSLILMSFYLLFLLMTLFHFWYRLIFFLIYVGAILVLVFYVVCVNSKPINTKVHLFNNVFLFAVFLYLQKKLSFLMPYIKLRRVKLKFKFFSSFNLLIICFLFFLLLFLLWVIRKFTFLSVGGIRRFV